MARSSRFTRCVWFSVIALLFATSVAAQRRDTEPTGTARVTGVVVNGTTGSTVAGASVRLSEPALGVVRLVQSDGAGRFSFDRLSGGQYFLTATQLGVGTGRFGQKTPDHPGFRLAVDASRERANVVVPVWPGGVVTGTVSDERGNLMPLARLTLLRSQIDGGERRLLPFGKEAEANDVGEFRLFDIAPGTYYLAVVPSASLRLADSTTGRTALVATYYPATTDVRDAAPVSVRTNEATRVQLVLQRRHVSNISGTVASADGAPASRGIVTARPKGGISTRNATIAANGSFKLTDVPDGEYTLHTVIVPVRGQIPLPAVATVRIDGSDVAGVQLQPVKPVRIGGRIIGSPQVVRELLLKNAQLGASNALREESWGALGAAIVQPDYSFDVPAWPGQVFLRLLQPRSVQIRAVRWNGIDVTDSGLDVARDAGALSGVEVEVTADPPVVSGSVIGVEALATAASVAIFPHDEKRRSLSRYLALGRVDPAGRFTVTSLPPGTYYVAVMPTTDVANWRAREVIDALIPKATTIVLREGTVVRPILTFRPDGR